MCMGAGSYCNLERAKRTQGFDLEHGEGPRTSTNKVVCVSVQGGVLELTPPNSVPWHAPFCLACRSRVWVLRPLLLCRRLGGEWVGNSICRNLQVEEPQESSLGHQVLLGLNSVYSWHLHVSVALGLYLLQRFTWALFCPLYQSP